MTADRRWIPLSIVIFTALFRLFMLGIKPPHHDEGVNGWFLDEMMRTGYFEYDPGNYHGPLHFYILFLFKVALGRNLWALRLPVVIMSTLTVWLVTKFDRFMDKSACWLAAGAMAISPAMEYFGRDAIHETDMVMFLILAVWGFAGIWRFGGMQYLWAAALGATGMILIKETYIIHFTAFVLAGVCLWLLEKVLPCKDPFPREKNAPPYSTRELWTVAGVCAGLILFFYSGTFLNPMLYTVTPVPMHLLALHWDFPMPTFLIKTFYEPFTQWVKTGNAGNGHEKTAYDVVLATIHLPWAKKGAAQPVVVNYYWLALMARYELPALAGMFASLFYIWPKSDRFIRYLMIYGWGAFAAYSIVHYKTPWCIVTIMWPFLFVFGHFFSKWNDVDDGRAPAVITAGFLLVVSLFISVRLSFWHYADDKEDYVYVQTFDDLNKLTVPLFKLIAKDRNNYHMRGVIIMDSTHPLPWVLGDFTDIDYSMPDPEHMDAAFLLVDSDHDADVQKALRENYFTEPFQLRSSLDPVTLYLNYNTFHDLFPGRKAEFVQGISVPAPLPVVPDESGDKTP